MQALAFAPQIDELEFYQNSGVLLSGKAFRALEEGSIVWLVYIRHGEPLPRIDNPSYLKSHPGERGWVLEDGSVLDPADFSDDQAVFLEDEVGQTHLYVARYNNPRAD